jgi:hypothetical protein
MDIIACEEKLIETIPVPVSISTLDGKRIIANKKSE